MIRKFKNKIKDKFIEKLFNYNLRYGFRIRYAQNEVINYVETYDKRGVLFDNRQLSDEARDFVELNNIVWCFSLNHFHGILFAKKDHAAIFRLAFGGIQDVFETKNGKRSKYYKQ